MQRGIARTIIAIFFMINLLSTLTAGELQFLTKSSTANDFTDTQKFNIINKRLPISLDESDIVWRFQNQQYPFIASIPYIVVNCPQAESSLTSWFHNWQAEWLKYIKISNNKCQINLVPDLYKAIKIDAIKPLIARSTYNLMIDVETLSAEQLPEFLAHFSTLNSELLLKESVQHFRSVNKMKVNLDELVMPMFYRAFHGTFPMYKGMNHAFSSLSFVDSGIEHLLSKKRTLNKYYSIYYIENEQFELILNDFYLRLDPKSLVKFGDILVFSEPISGIALTLNTPTRIVHSVVYIASGYVFGKMGLGVNEPFCIQSWEDIRTQLLHNKEKMKISIYRRHFSKMIR